MEAFELMLLFILSCMLSEILSPLIVGLMHMNSLNKRYAEQGKKKKNGNAPKFEKFSRHNAGTIGECAKSPKKIILK